MKSQHNRQITNMTSSSTRRATTRSRWTPSWRATAVCTRTSRWWAQRKQTPTASPHATLACELVLYIYFCCFVPWMPKRRQTGELGWRREDMTCSTGLKVEIKLVAMWLVHSRFEPLKPPTHRATFKLGADLGRTRNALLQRCHVYSSKVKIKTEKWKNYKWNMDLSTHLSPQWLIALVVMQKIKLFKITRKKITGLCPTVNI